MFSRSPRALLVSGALSVLALSACGDSEVVNDASGDAASAPAAGGPAAIHTGMPLDSVYVVIGKGPFAGTGPADTIRVMNGHRARLIVTSNRMLRIILVRTSGGTIDSPVDRGQDSPIILEGQQVLGNGWADYDRLQKELNLPDITAKP